MDVAPLAAVAELWKRQRREVVAGFDGTSMLPTIAAREPLKIVCDGLADSGDIILFQNRGTPVVHRLLERKGRWLLTRGDNNLVPDPPVPAHALIGRVIALRGGEAWVPPPAWTETAEQRRLHVIASRALSVSAAFARIVVTMLWQSRRASDAFERLGIAGFCARMWSKTGGRIADVDVILTVTLSTDIDFQPVAGFVYARALPDSSPFNDAARLLGVKPEVRRDQEVFVATAGSGEVAACSFNDRPSGAVGHQRGVAVHGRYRGQSLGTSVLRYQARELRKSGVERVDYHVALTNRASRSMFDRLGARRTERWIIVTLLRRFRFPFVRRT